MASALQPVYGSRLDALAIDLHRPGADRIPTQTRLEMLGKPDPFPFEVARRRLAERARAVCGIAWPPQCTDASAQDAKRRNVGDDRDCPARARFDHRVAAPFVVA